MFRMKFRTARTEAICICQVDHTCHTICRTAEAVDKENSVHQTQACPRVPSWLQVGGGHTGRKVRVSEDLGVKNGVKNGQNPGTLNTNK